MKVLTVAYVVLEYRSIEFRQWKCHSSIRSTGVCSVPSIKVLTVAYVVLEYRSTVFCQWKFHAIWQWRVRYSDISTVHKLGNNWWSDKKQEKIIHFYHFTIIARDFLIFIHITKLAATILPVSGASGSKRKMCNDDAFSCFMH